MLYLLNPVKIIVLLTFLAGLFFLDKNKKENKILFAIISICFINEICASILKYNGLNIDRLVTFSVIVHNSLWLALIVKYLSSSIDKTVLYGYILLSLLNFLLFEGPDEFNYYTFVIGALLYTGIFIVVSIQHLMKERLSFFSSNEIILLTAPIMFFLGMSFMLSFRSHDLTSWLIFKFITKEGIKLYTVVNFSVNVIYYILINIYLLKERKTGHE